MSEILERVINYADDILLGTINAGVKHRWAARRFMKDLEDCQKEDSLFYFDEEALEDFYYFSREFKHVEGVLAGQNIELVDFQLFMAANILCFKKKSNGARRFRKVYIQLGRKNAKSQFLAILAAFITFLGDEKQRAFIAGWMRVQSDEVYAAIKSGIAGSELLSGKWREAYGKLEIFSNGSEIIPLSRETRKTGDGTNPSLAIIEEYHTHETSEIYDVLDSGTVARKEPLLVIITTAGFNMERPCFKEYEYASRIIDPEDDAENDDYFVMICEIDQGDDIKDESNWIKANPIVATYPEGLTSIRSALKMALDMPEKMRAFLTKTMNLWVDKKDDGYMEMSKWNECVSENISLTDIPLWVGADMSMTTDLTSVGWVGIDEEGHYVVGQHSFMPKERLKQRMAQDNVRFDLWAEQGHLTLTAGEVVNYTEVESWIKNFSKDKNTQEFAYDKWNALHLAQNLENEGFICVEMPQRIGTLSIPTKTFRGSVYDKEVKHNGDPLLRWAMNNAIVRMDDQENIMISKKLSKERIDPAAAIINAFARAMYGETKEDLSSHFLKNWSM